MTGSVPGTKVATKTPVDHLRSPLPTGAGALAGEVPDPRKPQMVMTRAYSPDMQVRRALPDELGDRLWRLIVDVEQQQAAPPFGEVLLTAMTEPGHEGIGVAAERKGELVAYGFAAPNPDGRVWTLELADASSAYGWFLGQVLDRLAVDGVEEAVLWLHTSVVEAPSNLVSRERDLHRMASDLPVEDDRAPPAGVVIRGLDVDRDGAALIELNNRAFAGHPEQGGWTTRDLDRRLAMSWFDPCGVRTAWIGGRMAAFNWTKVHRDPAPDGGAVGEIYSIGVDPSHQGRGLGRAIALDGFRYLAVRRSVTRAILYVDSSNTAAMRLYRSLGFVTEHVDRAYRWVGGR